MEENHLTSFDSNASTSNGKEMTNPEQERRNSKEKDTSSFREKWRDPVFKDKFLYSMFMAVGFIALGMYVGQHGPTFLDIQILTDTDLEASSAFFTGGNAGYLTGSIVTGLIYSKMNKVLLMFILTLSMGVANVIVPYCIQYELMIFIRFTTGAFAGGIDTALNSEHMRLWGTDANGLLQFLHFCFSLGGVISPLVAEPFLVQKLEDVQINETTTTAGNSSLSTNTTNNHDALSLRPIETRVHYVFIIVGIFAMVTSIPFLVIFLRHRRSGNQAAGHSDEKRKFSQRPVPFPLLIVMLVGICLFYFAYCCVEDTFFSFLMTFLVEEYDSISKTKGAFTTAIAWISFAVSRFLMIFMSKIFNPVQLLFIMTTSMAVAFTSFTIFAHLRIVDALPVFSALAALSCSGVFASGFSWMEAEMFQVTGIISSCILVSSSMGSITNPLILGYLMEDVDRMWFCYLLILDTFLMCSLFVILYIFTRCYIDKKYGTLASSLNINNTIEIEVSKTSGDNDDVECDDGGGGGGGGKGDDDDVQVSFIQK